MQKIEQLFVRACKSHDPFVRVHSVYRRFYLHSPSRNRNNYHLAQVLSRIADKYLDLRPSELLSALHPENRLLFNARDDDDHWTVATKLLTSRIAMSPTSRFPGLTHPLRFRTPMAA